MPEVEAVVVNYRRPKNIPEIVEALTRQTVPCSVTLIDCAPREDLVALYNPALVHRHLRFHENHGAYNRFLAGFFVDKPFVYFHDDDMLPGDRVLEHFLKFRNIPFGVLGQYGRRFPVDMLEYNTNEVSRGPELVPVDMVVRAYFVRTANLYHALRMKLAMDRLAPSQVKEDDMILSCGMRMFGNLPNYLTPQSSDPEQKINKVELPDAFAYSHRPNHLRLRTRTLRAIAQRGYVPLLRPIDKPTS